MYTEDNGADRYIKILPVEGEPEYVYFQPQHSYFVADITGGSTAPGAQLQLWEYGKNNLAQMFRMVKVAGENDTYFIQSGASGLYLTAHGKSQTITQEVFQGSAQQKWYFRKMDGATMAPPSAAYMYSLQNVMSGRFIDIPGAAPNQQRKEGKLQLWDMDEQPDRYVELFDAGDGYYYVHPLHSTEVWDVKGGSTNDGTDIQLWPINNTAAQRFKFEYAGEPLTYWIRNLNSGKYVDAFYNSINNNGCPVRIYPQNYLDNQKWRVQIFDKWQMPSKDLVFNIRNPYNNKYWDIGGSGAATNANGKNFIMWDLDNDGDRKFKIIPSGDYSWIYLQVQNGCRHVDIKGGSTDNGANLHLWDAHGGISQKFAVQFTSPTTCVLRTNCWKTADISGGLSDDWKKNGAELKQYDIHYHANQQFQLVYADGSNNGQPYRFNPIYQGQVQALVPSNYIHFTKHTLLEQQQKYIVPAKTDYSYTSYRDADNNMVVAIFVPKRKRAYVLKTEERDGNATIFIREEDSPGANGSTVIKLYNPNPKIVIQDLGSGKKYTYFNFSMDGWVDLAKKYAPQLRFHPWEFSYPSPVDGIINNAFKVKPLPENFTNLTTGIDPEVDINNQGTVVEIHRTCSKNMNQNGFTISYNYEIHYRVGVVNNDQIEFSGYRNLTTGVTPTIALNNHGLVIEAHRHATDNGIDIRYGKVNTANKNIDFKYSGNRTNGHQPSVTINDENIFIMVNENNGMLEYHMGSVSADNITYYSNTGAQIRNGVHPSIDLNNKGQVFMTYEDNQKIYYMTGQLDATKQSIQFNEPQLLGSGVRSNIALRDSGELIQLQQTTGKVIRPNGNDTGLYTMLYYRYGKLQVQGTTVSPTIDLSVEIELTSGENSDIAVSDNGDLLEIHQTDSDLNLDLHYRFSKGGYSQKLVTSLQDLPPYEGAYILARRVGRSWEAINAQYKIYVVINQVNNTVEYEYNFFYPSNGTSFAGLGPDSMKHVGDWEKIYVTVDAQGNIISCRYHHHAKKDTLSKEQLQFVADTHPVVFVANQTHASYWNSDISMFDTGDLVSNSGKHWDSQNNMEVVKIFGEIRNNNQWIHWTGAWGSTLNSPASKLWY